MLSVPRLYHGIKITRHARMAWRKEKFRRNIRTDAVIKLGIVCNDKYRRDGRNSNGNSS
jgi:hypothetical protein